MVINEQKYCNLPIFQHVYAIGKKDKLSIFANKIGGRLVKKHAENRYFLTKKNSNELSVFECV